jgi:hypothetical protein
MRKVVNLIEAKNLYDSGKTLKEIGQKFGVSDETIRQTFIKNNVKRKSKKVAKRKYSLNENFFEVINTQDKAYFLGFIYSDGWVSKNVMGIELSEQDLDILYKFRCSLETLKPLIFRKARKETHQNQYTLKVSSDKIVDDLKKLGVMENKTHSLKLNLDYFISDDIIKHFIRGVFDGDGTINKNYVSIVGNGEFLNGIKNYLETKDIKFGLYNSDCKSTNIKRLTFNNKNMVSKFYDYIYSDATLFLPRKKIKFMNALNISDNI